MTRLDARLIAKFEPLLILRDRDVKHKEKLAKLFKGEHTFLEETELNSSSPGHA
jgi:hypothetical protein